MRIDKLRVHNFRGFKDRTFDLDPSFNLFVGPNGSGKTSVLDALAVAAGTWLIGFPGHGSRHIRPDDVRIEAHEFDSDVRFEPQYPVEIAAEGDVMGCPLTWLRSLNGTDNRTTTGKARDVKQLAAETARAVQAGADASLPLISYYGAGRLCLEPRQHSRVTQPSRLGDRRQLSRPDAYRTSVDPRLSTGGLVEWIARQSWIEYQRGHEQSIYTAVRKAIVGCLEGGKDLYFDAGRGEVIVSFANQSSQPFANLSDGQRSMLALVGDVAQKAIHLNPHLGDHALQETTGVVLIDELEMHLHPTWQRRVVRDLKQTFPRIQFICTTHSPQILGEARRNEVILLGSVDGPVHPSATFGLSSDEILESVLLAPQRDEAIASGVNLLLQYLDELEVGAANNVLGDLRRCSESPSRLITRLETLIGNTRALIDDADAEPAE
jgi:predicted ATP-binding protein involved in virulence